MSAIELSQLLGNLGEFIGAIGIVVTLVYLAIQLRQNTASVRASAYQAWAQAAMAEQASAQVPSMSNTLSIGYFQPESLSQENWIQFASYCHQFVQRAESTWYLSKEDVIDSAVCDKEIERAAVFLAQAGPNQWWRAGARTQYTSGFREMIEPKIGSSSGFQVYTFTQGKGFHAGE